MKKLFLSLIALLLLSGVSFATNIPTAIEPNNGGPEVWVQSVYNNSTSSLPVGSVVIWQVGSSTGANDNWVNTTTTADTFLVAGVVWPAAIAAATTGTIAIKGPVSTLMATGGNTVGGLACSSTTAGQGKTCDTNGANFGIVTAVTASGSATVMVHATN